MKALLNGQVIAESNETINIEGNHYFPISSVKKEFLKPSDTHTTCHWKGVASYYTVSAEGVTIEDAAWYYPDPKPGAKMVKDRVAFWRGVEVTK